MSVVGRAWDPSWAADIQFACDHTTGSSKEIASFQLCQGWIWPVAQHRPACPRYAQSPDTGYIHLSQVLVSRSCLLERFKLRGKAGRLLTYHTKTDADRRIPAFATISFTWSLRTM